MGRLADLLGEIAAEAEEGPDGLLLSPDAWDRFRDEWNDEEIEDALGIVKETLLQSELVEAADSLSARLLDLLGDFGGEAEFEAAAAGKGFLSLEAIGQLARRVERLEDVLDGCRDGPSPDRAGFDALRARLADHGIEREMEAGDRDDDD
jgi:hypothetical protein